jgi:hypothetical protein
MLFYKKNIRFLFSSIFLITCAYLYAAEATNTKIYFGDAAIAGKEFFYVEPPVRTKVKKTVSNKELKTPSHPNKDITEKESTTEFSIFPSVPSSSSYFHRRMESAIMAVKCRFGDYQSVNKANGENTYIYIKNSNLSLYTFEQRQKLSIAATQCGILTSFSPNSPAIF